MKNVFVRVDDRYFRVTNVMKDTGPNHDPCNEVVNYLMDNADERVVLVEGGKVFMAHVDDRGMILHPEVDNGSEFVQNG